ncbi:S24 family peptidase [Psittacicella gerlachiana]|uniref:Peptidase S24/S26A/S26B/S26C domain-containing protein n=1 Tax=Psittacicella gerlachiana TaxID=2028574 RepID=A0A3A1Y3Z7_9GAMM|nr:S24 family peptidase [Psittacicella gerlachiana]RIY31976.1 hypothetical protein CKF59_07250 [Psittacicella gerlachiana]
MANKDNTNTSLPETPKRGRGRPRKINVIKGSPAALGLVDKEQLIKSNKDYVPYDKLHELTNFANNKQAVEDFTNRRLAEANEKNTPTEIPGFFVEMLDVEASAGPGTYNEGYVPTQQVFISNSEYYRNLYTENPNNLRVLKIRGDSMEPILHDGQTCIVRLENNFTSSGIYVFTYGDVTFIKRLQKTRDSFVAISENIKYPPFIIEDSQNFIIHGKLILGLDYTRL